MSRTSQVLLGAAAALLFFDVLAPADEPPGAGGEAAAQPHAGLESAAYEPGLVPEWPPELRVAVEVSGSVRTLSRTFASMLAYVLDPHDADCFAYVVTSADDDLQQRGLAKLRGYGRLRALVVVEWDHATEREFLGGAVAERHPEYPYTKLQGSTHATRFLSMAYGLDRVGELRRKYAGEHGVAYDAVVRIRPDLELAHPLQLRGLFPVASPSGTVFVPACCDKLGGLNDNLAIGDAAGMDAYDALFDETPSIYADGEPLHPERYLRETIRRRGATVRRIDLLRANASEPYSLDKRKKYLIDKHGRSKALPKGWDNESGDDDPKRLKCMSPASYVGHGYCLRRPAGYRSEKSAGRRGARRDGER